MKKTEIKNIEYSLRYIEKDTPPLKCVVLSVFYKGNPFVVAHSKHGVTVDPPTFLQDTHFPQIVPHEKALHLGNIFCCNKFY